MKSLMCTKTGKVSSFAQCLCLIVCKVFDFSFIFIVEQLVLDQLSVSVIINECR